MDTTDTTTPTTDLVIIDAELVEETPNFESHSLAHTVSTTAATSAVILGAMLAYKYLKPKVASLLSKKKDEEPVVVEVVEAPAETPETVKA